MRQIRDAEFDAELQSRLRDADQARATEIKLAQAEIEMQHAAERSQQLQEISRLESVLKSAEAERELELTKALADLSSKADKLKNELELSAAQKELDLQKQKASFDILLKAEQDEVARLKDFKAKRQDYWRNSRAAL
jgi:signal transduction histidine kinase